MAVLALLLLALTLASAQGASWRLTGGVLGAIASVALAQVAPAAFLVAVPVVSLACLLAAQVPLPIAGDALLRTQLSGMAMGLLVRQGVPPLVAIVGGALPTVVPELSALVGRHGRDLLAPDPGEVDRSVAMTLDLYRKFKVPQAELERSQDVLRQVSAFLISLVPAFQFLGILSVFFMIYLVCQSLLARFGLAIRPVGRFPLWKLSHWYVWLFAAGLMAVLLPGQSFQIAGRNILFVMSLAYFVQGLSVTQFLMVRRGVGFLVRLFIYGVGMVAVFPFFAAMTTGIGLFDTWFDFRGLEPAEPAVPEENKDDD